MIICRTPFRISFFGGGTDYPVWYQENGGAVLGTTIDKYCYITGRCLPPFFEHKYRIVYSQAEHVRSIGEICHPAVRETLRYSKITDGMEIHHDGDLPARTGLGSSSSFTVGLLHTLYALKGIMPSKMQLAKEAINIEQNVLKENVGCQDQVMAAFGGFNRVLFSDDGNIELRRVTVQPERLELLQDHLLLVFTGFSRMASDIAEEQIRQTPNRKHELAAMYQMVDAALDILNGGGDITEFGKLLHESWQLKRSLTDKISTPHTDDLYEMAIRAGATGGKLLGAGGGGFMLFFVKPELRSVLREALGSLLCVPFRFESSGSQIIFYEPDLFYGKTRVVGE
ncbi:MAG: GHMP kinase [Dehalococcoidales bacterium]|jgi:D-glycero-alpha-D-manno-heptose-7-phosphate kinase|nr:GHMP kinase [Dehalococcoidales bacterium]MDP6737965.1 GHMP kinase [Dehalococcoidales bacterium]|tara:strand:- start:16808 stop:17827 length:1020 start_codon:yes stop_codon:yes gene_type:complete